MQKERQQLLLITSYNGVYQVGYKIPIHSLWHAVEVLPQPSYVTSLCKSAIVFDQKMRQHLVRCFRQRKLSSFPHFIGYKPKQMHFPFHEIEVFCTCQTPETWDNMVCCDSCGEWYHLRCINLRSMLNSVEQWFCSTGTCNLLYLLQFLFLLLFDSINVYDCE